MYKNSVHLFYHFLLLVIPSFSVLIKITLVYIKQKIYLIKHHNIAYDCIVELTNTVLMNLC